MVLGSPLDKATLDSLMVRSSTKVHDLVHAIFSMNNQLSEISDADLEQIYIDAGSVDGVAERAAFRSWQSAMKGYADNYMGMSTVLNRGFEIAKRVQPTL